MNILALESSGLAASVAVISGGKVMGEFYINNKMTHSQTLMPLAESLLNITGFEKKDIECIAVSAGPGSFTGLRIGMASAKGLAKALGVPVAVIPTLDIIAYNMIRCGKTVVPIMDARRERVYFSAYNTDGKYPERLLGYDTKPIDEVLDAVSHITDDAVFIGDGTAVYGREIENAGFKIGDMTQIYQKASALGALAEIAAAEGKLVNGGEVKLMYLRKPQAEREREAYLKEISFRPMKSDDVEAMAEIEKKCFSEPWTAKMIEDDYKNGLTYYIICEKQGKIIGYGGMWHVINEGHITNIALAPEEQGKGIGSKLMEEIIKLAEKKEMIGLTLEVRASNERAIGLYSKYGFKTEGVRPDYYEDNHESALIMWKRMYNEG